MSPKKLNATLLKDDIQDVLAYIDAIYEKLPFLMGLTHDERRELVKLNHDGRPFVEQSLSIGAKYHQLVPGCVDIDAAINDIELYVALEPVLHAMKHLQSLMEDTRRIAGSEAYAAAREVYHSVKRNGKALGLESTITELARQFPRTRRSSKQEAA